MTYFNFTKKNIFKQPFKYSIIAIILYTILHKLEAS